MTPARLVPPVLAILLIAQEMYASRGRRAEVQARDRGSLHVVWIATALGYWAGFGLWSHPPGPRLGRWSLWVGATVALAGMGLRTWSVATLGRYFTYVVKVSDDQPVIDWGPYRLIRHPSYAGGALTAIGIGLSLSYAWAPLIIAAPYLTSMTVRMKVEEEALAETIGAPYRAYMARTRRLIPFVY